MLYYLRTSDRVYPDVIKDLYFNLGMRERYVYFLK
jgi:hypothetical protein